MGTGSSRDAPRATHPPQTKQNKTKQKAGQGIEEEASNSTHTHFTGTTSTLSADFRFGTARPASQRVGASSFPPLPSTLPGRLKTMNARSAWERSRDDDHDRGKSTKQNREEKERWEQAKSTTFSTLLPPSLSLYSTLALFFPLILLLLLLGPGMFGDGHQERRQGKEKRPSALRFSSARC